MKFAAAILVGLGVGVLLSPEPVVVPALGPVPGVAVGAAGLLVGAVAYRWGPGFLGASGCGCAGDCDCA